MSERWGSRQRNEQTNQMQRYFDTDGAEGCSYRAIDLTADYINHQYAIFGSTSRRTFPTNYRNWAERFRQHLEQRGGRRAYERRQSE